MVKDVALWYTFRCIKGKIPKGCIMRRFDKGRNVLDGDSIVVIELINKYFKVVEWYDRSREKDYYG